MSDPYIYTYRATYMQRIADYVRTGHTKYVLGRISIEKASDLYDKFSALYDVHLTPMQASRKRAKGYATGRLLFTPVTSNTNFKSDDYYSLDWILLLTPGELKAKEFEHREKWLNPFNAHSRIVLNGLELVRLTKPNEPKPVLTWRIQKDGERLMREQIRDAIRRKRDDQLRAILKNLDSTPGFAGAREQIKKLKRYIKAEWKRSRAVNEPMPDLKYQYYLQRLNDKGLAASQLLAQRKKRIKEAEKEQALRAVREAEALAAKYSLPPL